MRLGTAPTARVIPSRVTPGPGAPGLSWQLYNSPGRSLTHYLMMMR